MRVFNLKCAVRHSIKEITVVRNNDVRPVVILQKILQPFNRRNIKVVRRLVQQQQIRFAEQHFCELNFRFLSAAQNTDRSINLLRRKAEADECAFCTVAAGEAAVCDETIV